MYLGYQRLSRSHRSALGLSLDEVVNAPYLRAQLMRYTVKGPGSQACWLWSGPKTVLQKNGHWYWRARLFVVLERGYLQISPARLAYLFDAGILEDKRRIRHTCNESLCVRPDHIVLANQSKTYWARVKPQKKQQEREEMARVIAEQAMLGVPGETIEQLRFYAWLGEPAKSLAKSFGVSVHIVERILQTQSGPESAPVLAQAEG